MRSNMNLIKTRLSKVFSIIFWVVVWQLAALKIDYEVLLPTPLRVIQRLGQIFVSTEFLNSVLTTFTSILCGFFLALITAVILASISGSIKFVRILLTPFMSMIKSIPVASFVILALFWFDSSSLSAFVSFIMVLPVIYINVLSGVDETDTKMCEMATVFKVSPIKRVVYIYIPYAIPYFKSGCAIALGLCWKAGVAAELIGVPRGTIGEQLYFSKTYFETADLFAWTIVIIAISVIFEKLFMLVLNKAVLLYERS